MNITIIPQLSDNYCYHVVHPASGSSFIVDACEPHKIDAYMSTRVASDYGLEKNVEFTHVLTTHKHSDHSGGNKAYSKKTIVGGKDDNVPYGNFPVVDGQVFTIGAMKVTCIHTPCHTRGHILFLVEVEDGMQDYSCI